MTVHFINLTNGIQAIEDYGLVNYRFIRLQSTACEQKRWEDIILSISDDLLMHVALGHHCIVYDYGANKGVPRAVWQGLEWLKYVLARHWHHKTYTPQGRASTCGSYFMVCYKGLSNRARARLTYFGHYGHGPTRITAVTRATNRDGDFLWYDHILGGNL